MNIAIITEEYPPHKGGGIAEWCLGIGENIVSYGHSITILCKKKKKFDYRIYKAKPYSFQPMKGHDWHHFRFWYSLFYLRQYLKKYPDALIIASTWELAFAFYFLKKIYKNSRIIVGVHGTEITRDLSNRKIKYLIKTVEAANWIIPVSNYTLGELRKKIGTRFNNKIVVIPNGVNTVRFIPVSNAKIQSVQDLYSIPESQHILLTLARIVERKGCDIVIQSLPEIVNKYPDTIYIIAGSGDRNYLQLLHELAKKMKMESHVFFTGFIKDEDLPALYTIADLYIMMSRPVMNDGDSEGFGITFLEANACECPVIGSAAGGIPDAVENGISGLLVPPDDPQQLSQTILKLFDSPEKLKKIGISGRRRVENNFTWQNVAQKVEGLINS